MTVAFALLFARILTSWTLFFLNGNEGYRWGKAIFFACIESLLVASVHFDYMISEPLFMLTYRLAYYPKERFSQRTYYCIFPIVLTNLLIQVNSYFIMPFLTKIPVIHVEKDSLLQVLCCLLVLPLLTIIEHVFAIEDYSFNQNYLKRITQFLSVTNTFLLGYYFYMLLFDNPIKQDFSKLWISKIVTLFGLFVLFYLASYLNYYLNQKVMEQIEESQRHHLLMLERYNAYIENLYRGIRSFKHDYDNILLSLAASINQGDLPIIQSVYQETMEKMHKTTNQISVFERQRFEVMENPDLEIFFTLKKHELEEGGLISKIICETKLDQLPLKVFDLLVILSTVIDYAAFNTQDHPSPFITLFLNKNVKGDLYIMVESYLSIDDRGRAKNQKNITEKTNLILDYFKEQLPVFRYKREEKALFLSQTLIVGNSSLKEGVN